MINHLASLWIGRSLSPIEQLSITSFLAHGHPYTLYAYNTLDGVPKGVEIRDAREILTTTRILRYAENGSPALHSNLFRYALMQKTDKLWVDLDMIALRPFDFSTGHVFGLQEPGLVNGAVLRLPANSAALKSLLRLSEHSRAAPPTRSLRKKVKCFLRTRGRGYPIEQWRWGASGPELMTRLLDKSTEIRMAMPVETFYPVSWRNADQFLKPGAISLGDFPDAVYGVHLWGKFIHHRLSADHGGTIPDGSFILDALRAYRLLV